MRHTVKQMLQFSRSIWDATVGSMVNVAFVLEIDTDKIPLAPLHKARKNKRGTSKALSGAISIRPSIARQPK